MYTGDKEVHTTLVTLHFRVTNIGAVRRAEQTQEFGFNCELLLLQTAMRLLPKLFPAIDIGAHVLAK